MDVDLRRRLTQSPTVPKERLDGGQYQIVAKGVRAVLRVSQWEMVIYYLMLGQGEV